MIGGDSSETIDKDGKEKAGMTFLGRHHVSRHLPYEYNIHIMIICTCVSLVNPLLTSIGPFYYLEGPDHAGVSCGLSRDHMLSPLCR